MMPGSKDLTPYELAHRWVKDLGTHPDMSIKVGAFDPDIIFNCKMQLMYNIGCIFFCTKSESVRKSKKIRPQRLTHLDEGKENL